MPIPTAASSAGSQGLVFGHNHQLEYFFSEIDSVRAVQLEMRDVESAGRRKTVFVVEIPRRELGVVVLADRPHMDSRQIENPDDRGAREMAEGDEALEPAQLGL